MKTRNKLSRANILELHDTCKFGIPLTPDQQKEFQDLADGLYSDINDNRKKAGELPLYETQEIIPTLADLEFVRELVCESV